MYWGANRDFDYLNPFTQGFQQNKTMYLVKTKYERQAGANISLCY